MPFPLISFIKSQLWRLMFAILLYLKQTIPILPIKQVFCPSMLITGIIWHHQVGVGVFLQFWSVTPTGYNSTATHTLGRPCSRDSLWGSQSSLSSGNSKRPMAPSHPVCRTLQHSCCSPNPGHLEALFHRGTHHKVKTVYSGNPHKSRNYDNLLVYLYCNGNYWMILKALFKKPTLIF